MDDLVRTLPSWQIRAIRFNDVVARRLGIASSDLHCLFALDRGGPSTPGALAASVGLTTGAATRMVDRLVAAELVERAADPADRRRVVVTIAAEASRRLHALYDPLDERLRDRLTPLDDGTLASLLEFIVDAERLTAESEPR